MNYSKTGGKKAISISKLFLPSFLMALFCIQTGCQKFVEVQTPITSLTGENVFTNDATAISAITSVYASMSSGNIAEGLNSITFASGLSSDELTLFSGSTNTTLQQLYKNRLSSLQPPDFWRSIYNYMYTLNEALEGLSTTNSLTSAVKQQLTGEAKFLRAFFYFYLVNLYGDVPLTTSSDWGYNAKLSRTPKAEVYQQIISDLEAADTLLSANYLDATLLNQTGERVRPTKWAASALLARTYLYTDSFPQAEAQASLVINNTSMYDTVSLNNVFLDASQEAIWQLQTVSSSFDTQDGNVFILKSEPNNYSNPVYLSPFLLNAFEPGDNRRTNWVDSIISGATYYFPYKYKVSLSSDTGISENLMVLRLGEQYLIRAEARAEQGNIAGAQADLNIIRARAGLPNTSATDQPTLLTAILHERQVELFTEWGHRWFDLKRTGTVDAVMGSPGNVCAAKGGVWNTDWQLYPVSHQDIILAPNLTQNAGY